MAGPMRHRLVLGSGAGPPDPGIRPPDPKGRRMAEEIDEDIEADAEPQDPDEVDLEDEAEDEPADDDDDAVLVDETDDTDDIDKGTTTVAPVTAPTTATEDDEEEDEEEPDDEDVEASLDVILNERLVVPDHAEEEEDEVAADTDERPEAAVKILPKQPDEFVCQSCFLVKHPSQLADPDRMLCRDCV